MRYFLLTSGMDYYDPNFATKMQKILIRGDSLGRISVWFISDDINENFNGSITPPDIIDSLTKSWTNMKPLPCGIVDQLLDIPSIMITASVYLPLQGRLVCGREDGSIIIISATQTIMLQLLLGKHQTYEGWPQHQILTGHAGKVNCLLYPHHFHNRYDIAHLLSGGVDFSICLWDLYAGTLLHRFCVQAGEITQLLVPPKDCNVRQQYKI